MYYNINKKNRTQKERVVLMKYNMKEIMKRAHELVKKAKVTLSTALKMSWVVAKRSLIAEHDRLDGGQLTWNIWVGYGHVEHITNAINGADTRMKRKHILLNYKQTSNII